MGLFDKRDKGGGKRRDDFDSPVESVDLNSALDEPAAEPRSSMSAPAPAPGAPAAAAPAAARKRAPSELEPEAGAFGIDKAIQLMRTLPTDNIELVVQVVKLTLESTRIKIATIIDDATRRQDDIQGRIKVLRDEIADFEKEIATRREEISGLEADFSETSTVKDRLQLAEKLSTGSSGGRAATAPGPAPSAAPSAPASSAPSGGLPTLPRPSGSMPAASPPGSTPGSHTVVAKK
ncbi:MAG TPA: hypothetical protein VL172_11330 [Kofleriaceae bacterium]|jgi:hypothetical protein|nr:hypothetical protein [Kofleriaceae bacterium]